MEELAVFAGLGGVVALLIGYTRRPKPITRLGLSDHNGETVTLNNAVRALTKQALTEVSTACYGWKNVYCTLRPGGLTESESAEDGDIWDVLRRTQSLQYSEPAWTHYLPLFTV